MRLKSKETKSLIKRLIGRKTIPEFAQEMGITHQTVRNWLHGDQTPSPVFQRLLREYAEKNGIEIPELK